MVRTAALAAPEIAELRVMAQAGGRSALRARVLLLAAEGHRHTEIAALLGVSRQSVVTWRRRYAAGGIRGLRDRPHHGRPTSIDSWEIMLRSLAPPRGRDCWTSRSLASALGISGATVVRAWQQHGARPMPGGRVRLAAEPPVDVGPVEILGTRPSDGGALVLRTGPADTEVMVAPPMPGAPPGAHLAPDEARWREMVRVLRVLHDRSVGAAVDPRAEVVDASPSLQRPRHYESQQHALRVTMREVAAAARVSMKTVSNVLTGSKRVAPSTRARVEAAIERLGYQVNTAARQLRTGRRGTVVLAVPEFRVNYFAELAEQLIDAGAERDVTMQVQVTRGDRDREREIISTARGVADGVIMVGQGLTERDLGGLSGSGPFVLLGENISGTSVDHITISNAGAARTAMTHLLAAGCRRVALLGTGSTAVAAARVRGAQEAAAALGVDLDPALMVPAGPWHRDAGERATVALLEAGVPFDAVLGFNDELALGAVRALLTHGVTVPTQVAVVGFDNSRDAAYSTPSLTSIAPDMAHIARRALDLIEERQHRRAGAEPAHIIAPHTLAVRESAP
ncbi:substrate-binding domain-containing protein [Pseudactinotalea sp.]|uniref:substrate-binding domain-containing protein n=1 Tax=Pseudactinotalea sp. TaxID=1926260 RepID=UPI003B3B30DF